MINVESVSLQTKIHQPSPGVAHSVRSLGPERKEILDTRLDTLEEARMGWKSSPREECPKTSQNVCDEWKNRINKNSLNNVVETITS
jgi:hypothetical protein